MSNIVTPSPWSTESLYAKAQLYLNEMDSYAADEWQYGFWSSLCLELLLRASLAKISPILLADSGNWRNVTHALGQEPTAKKFTPSSIPTKEVIARLKELVPTFNDEIAGFCGTHTDRRNAELHSGEMVFSSVGTSDWLPKFYKACRVLLQSFDNDLADFVQDPDNAIAMIESLQDAAAKAVNQDIKAHAKVWENKTEDERNNAILQATTWATRHTGHRTECPSCNSPALLQGSPSGEVTTSLDEDEIVQKQTMLPSSFECIACGLKVSGYSKLSACGLGDAFSEKTTYTAAEFFELYTEDDLEEAREEGRSESGEYEPDFNEY